MSFAGSTALGEWMGSSNIEGMGRLWGKLMHMRKIDIAMLDAAFRGA